MIATIAESVLAARTGWTTSSTKVGSRLNRPLEPRHPPSAAQNVNPLGSRVLTTSLTKPAPAESVTPSAVPTFRPKYCRSGTTDCAPLDWRAGAQDDTRSISGTTDLLRRTLTDGARQSDG